MQSSLVQITLVLRKKRSTTILPYVPRQGKLSDSHLLHSVLPDPYKWVHGYPTSVPKPMSPSRGRCSAPCTS